MGDKAKAITFGLILGFAFGGLIGSATFGGWGGIVGSLLGLLFGGGTMAIIATASLSAQAENPRQEDAPEVQAKH
jgi:hypothetical protein